MPTNNHTKKHSGRIRNIKLTLATITLLKSCKKNQKQLLFLPILQSCEFPLSFDQLKIAYLSNKSFAAQNLAKFLVFLLIFKLGIFDIISYEATKMLGKLSLQYSES